MRDDLATILALAALRRLAVLVAMAIGPLALGVVFSHWSTLAGVLVIGAIAAVGLITSLGLRTH